MENREEQIKVTRKKKNNGKKIGIAILLVLLIGGGIGAFLWWQGRSAMDATTQYYFDKYAQDGILEGKTPAEIQSILNSIVEEGMFNVSTATEVRFADGKSEGELGFENIPANRYYARVVLKREDNNEVIYKSEGIKPGQYINNIKLSKNLPKGDYPCVAEITATDPDTLDDIGQIDVKILVRVLN